MTATVTITIIFHGEGAFAIPALRSMHDLIRVTTEAGIEIESRAILDRVDGTTSHIVAELGGWLDETVSVDFGDLASSRNEGVARAEGEYLAFLDGDDLWGSNWIVEAHRAAMNSSNPENTVWHPEYLFYFDESDFDRQSTTTIPRSDARSFFLRQTPSNSELFDLRTLKLENVWSANAFALRSLHERYPYRPSIRHAGFGVEDWAWNIETSLAGVFHLVVSDSVHLIRVKETGSLGQNNVSEGLLPFVANGY